MGVRLGSPVVCAVVVYHKGNTHLRSRRRRLFTLGKENDFSRLWCLPTVDQVLWRYTVKSYFGRRNRTVAGMLILLLVYMRLLCLTVSGVDHKKVLFSRWFLTRWYSSHVDNFPAKRFEYIIDAGRPTGDLIDVTHNAAREPTTISALPTLFFLLRCLLP